MFRSSKITGLSICIPAYSIAVYFLGLSITASIFVIHVAVVPLLFKYSKTFQRNLIFANHIQWPIRVDFEDPSARGIKGGRNLSIQFESKVDKCPIEIGIWHFVPSSVYKRLKEHFDGNADKEELNRILDEELATSKKPIIFYCHGNSNSRAATHRIKLYKFFQEMDFHTIAFDYRGYGDSTNIYPSEAGVVEDALVVYDWLMSTVDKGGELPSVYVWGHSLGTGIASHLLGNLNELSKDILEKSSRPIEPKGLILEAPFNNLVDEIYEHPMSKLVIWLNWYETSFICPFVSCFRSDEHLRRVPDLPVLILHAEDDRIVPFVVGNQLYETLVTSRGKNGATVKMHAYKSSLGLGHKWICNAQDLPKVVREFVESHP